jgi:hypothetical protein
VFADHDHCIDDEAPGDDLHMVLDKDTVEFVTARDVQ